MSDSSRPCGLQPTRLLVHGIFQARVLEWGAIAFSDIPYKKTIIQKDTCTPVFIAAIFTKARTWKQPRCPLTDEWIKKMWNMHTMEYYSTIKRNGLGSFVEMEIDLESVIQSEVSQKEKNTCLMLMHKCGIYKNCMDEPVCRAGIETQMLRTNL